MISQVVKLENNEYVRKRQQKFKSDPEKFEIVRQKEIIKYQ